MMNNRSDCEYAPEIVSRLKNNDFGDDDRKHLQICAECRQTARIVRFLQLESVEKIEPAKLPTAGLVWWKHRRNEKDRAAEHAAQPIYIFQILAAVTAFAVFIWLLPNLPPLAPVFGQVFAAVEQIIPLLAAGFVCFAVISITLILILRRFLVKN